MDQTASVIAKLMEFEDFSIVRNPGYNGSSLLITAGGQSWIYFHQLALDEAFLEAYGILYGRAKYLQGDYK